MKPKIIGTALFFLVLILIPVLTFTGKKETVSYNENKVLATFPKFSIGSCVDRSFMNGISSYFSDHFVFREQFIKLKNDAVKFSGKKDIKDVIELDGKLIMLFKNEKDDQTETNIKSIESLVSAYPDVSYYFMPVFTAQEKYKDKIPAYLNIRDERDYFEIMKNSVSCVTVIDTGDAINHVDYAFYNTDHHWTTECAYQAYLTASEVMGFEPQKFATKRVSDSFKGTLFSKTLNDRVAADCVTAYYSNNSQITYSYGDSTFSSLFFDEYLTEKDKYLYFLSGNQGVCFVKNKSVKNDKKLLLIKDSYANCMIPMFAENYSEITIIDPRYCSASQIKNIDPEEFDDVLILFNIIGFSQEKNFSLISYVGKQ